MIFEHYSKHKRILFSIFAVFLLAGMAYLAYNEFGSNDSTTVCTLEAKLFLDGTSVGRSGPDCEFAACPGIEQGNVEPDSVSSDNENGVNPVVGQDMVWQRQADSATGISFEYPDQLSTNYISTTDWPPALEVVDESYSCTEGGTETRRAGQTKKKTINGHEYCVTKLVEGAAGSIYTQYTFAGAYGGHTLIMSFSHRSTQCGNYDEAQMAECEDERNAFNIDPIVDRMSNSAG